ncbi:MAG: glycosyltransferase [Pseudomonadota bacterium]
MDGTDQARTTNGTAQDHAAPVVTVVIPTHNRRRLVQRAVKSALGQSLSDIEVLVLDDGSSDDTCASIKAMGDARVRLICGRRKRGAGYRRAQGAREARGRYVAFLDSDDYWGPHKLSEQVRAAERAGAPVCVASSFFTVIGADVMPARKPKLRAGERIAHYLYRRGGTLQTSGLLVDAELGQRVRFDPNLSVHQDTDFCLRLEQAGARFVFLDQRLYFHDVDRKRERISGDSSVLVASRQWFARTSASWTPAERRGFLLCDYTERLASLGFLRQARAAYLSNFDLGIGLKRLVRLGALAMFGSGVLRFLPGPQRLASLWRRGGGAKPLRLGSRRKQPVQFAHSPPRVAAAEKAQRDR